jgi:hypothetical protein
VVDRDPAPGRAAQAQERIVIHLERVVLPAGLRALACRDAHGNLVIYVSETLDAARQRAAVVTAIRASRRAGWRAGGIGLPSAGIAVLLGVRTLLRHSVAVIKARPLAWGAAASSAVLGASAAGVFITTVPHHHSPAASPRPSVPSAIQPLTPQDRTPTHTGHQVRARAAASPGASGGSAPRPASTGQPQPAPTASGGSTAPSPAPAPTEPSPSPSPSGGVCVIVLGIRVCVPSVGVSAGT